MNLVSGTPIKVLHNGSIHGHPRADTIVLERDRIRMIGRADELPLSLSESEGTEHIDLKGRFVLPGFIDAHIHLLHTGLVESGWRIGLMNLSRAEVLAELAQAAKERSGEWTVGYGWDESQWQDRCYLTRTELDKISPRSPVLAIRMDGHLMTANSRAMEQIPETAPEDLIEREAGLLREKAVTEMTGSIRPDHAAAVEGLDAAARLCHRLGITTVHTMTPFDYFEAFMARRQQRKLRITICPDIQSFDKLLAVGLKTGTGDTWLRFGGIKMFADGSIGAGNAAVSQPYIDGGLGELNHADAVLECWVETADRAGWQTVIHAIGDRAIEQVLRTHEGLQTNTSLRHRIEHFELPQESQLARVKKAGLHLSMQPNFTANWSGPDSMYVDRLGVDRDRLSNPLRLIHDADIPLAFGSDGMPPSPLYGLHGAIHGAYPGQRLTIEEAIACYTMAGARFGFEEDEKGCLQAGKLADLVVLDQDPQLNPEHMSQRSIEMTFVGGDLVYSSDDEA
ncbi:amidohydrolase [Candidatus Bipolaricaulota bacterium]|nr:amidohydrolase [Candidatus Bipolaricaulota bacterium]